MTWARLLARVDELDVTTRPRCGAAMQAIAFITDAQSIRRILASVGEPTAPPATAPARLPASPLDDSWDDAAWSECPPSDSGW